jgi:hypothetical protein
VSQELGGFLTIPEKRQGGIGTYFLEKVISLGILSL